MPAEPRQELGTASNVCRRSISLATTDLPSKPVIAASSGTSVVSDRVRRSRAE
jgi:hypothetical protein